MGFSTSLTNHFLIAMPGLQDPNFSRTVTYVCEHTDQGAMGIIINRPTEVTLGELLDQLDIPTRLDAVRDTLVYQGGPVQTDRGFVLHTAGPAFDSTLNINDQISVTTSRDVLEAIARGEGPAQTLIALGYAGWGGGQLEQETERQRLAERPGGRRHHLPARRRVALAGRRQAPGGRPEPAQRRGRAHA